MAQSKAKKKVKKVKKHEGEEYCPSCDQYKKIKEFYLVKDNESRNNASMYCKDCTKAQCYYTPAQEHIDIVRFQQLLRRMNVPFMATVFATVEANKSETVGRYLGAIKLGQYKNLEWHDSKFTDDIKENAEYIKNFASRTDLQTMIVDKSQVSIFAGYTVSYEYLRHKYGKDFDDYEMIEFERAYFKIKKGYSVATEADEASLITASISQVKMVKAMADDKANRKDITEWSKIYNQSVSKLNKVDFTGKLGSYSMLMRALEESEDVVTIFPDFLEVPKDDIDMILFAHIFKDRELLGLDNSELKYGDMYKFYEKIKKEILKEQDNDDTQENKNYIVIGD
jgi:hypothetical protein